MKRNLFLIMAVLLASVCSTKAAYTVTSSDVTANVGGKATMQVSFTNEQNLKGFELDILLPEGVTFESVKAAERANGLSLSYNLTEGMYKFAVLSTTGAMITGTDGVVFETVLAVDNSVEAGEYEIKISNTTFYTEDYDEIDVPTTTATLTILPQEVSLVHGEAYEGSETMEGVTVKYSRSFAHTEWQALYVPFNMAFDDWKNIGQVAELTGVTGTADAPVLEWTIVESGRISANTPYIFKPKAEGAVTFTCEGATLEAAAENSVAKTIGGATITLTGIYKTKSDMATDKAYGLSKGVFRPTTDNKHTLSPYLIYLKINAPTAQAPACVLNGVGGGGTTEIKIIGIETDQTEATYDLQGRISSHGNGFEISNGKIVFNK